MELYNKAEQAMRLLDQAHALLSEFVAEDTLDVDRIEVEALRDRLSVAFAEFEQDVLEDILRDAGGY